MNANKLIPIALAALLVFAGGAAAMPGNAPDDAGSDTAVDRQPDDPSENATDDDAENESVSPVNVTDDADARDENATEGPPTEMPEQVPDHVSQIHNLIREKLDGTLGNQTLGEAINGLIGNGNAAPAESDTDSSANESAGESDDEANTRSNNEAAGPPSNLPHQAADHVSQIHDAIMSFLNGDGDGNPGDEVSSTAG